MLVLISFFNTVNENRYLNFTYVVENDMVHIDIFSNELKYKRLLWLKGFHVVNENEVLWQISVENENEFYDVYDCVIEISKKEKSLRYHSLREAYDYSSSCGPEEWHTHIDGNMIRAMAKIRKGWV